MRTPSQKPTRPGGKSSAIRGHFRPNETLGMTDSSLSTVLTLGFFVFAVFTGLKKQTDWPKRSEEAFSAFRFFRLKKAEKGRKVKL
jgi:hypothetical protein